MFRFYAQAPKLVLRGTSLSVTGTSVANFLLSQNNAINQIALDSLRIPAEEYLVGGLRTISELPRSSQLASLFGAAPVREVEIDTAITSINERPDLVDSCVPSHLSERREELRETILNGVRNMLADADLVQQTCARIEEAAMSEEYVESLRALSSTESSNGRQTAEAIVDVYSEQQGSEIPIASTDCTHSRTRVECREMVPTSSWDALCDEFETCAICLDLLAAPTIVECGHSFCGLCIDDYMSSCRSHDSRIEVIHTCPNDRVEFTNVIFERLLDRNILRKVEGLTDLTVAELKLKEEWTKRRNEYLRRREEQSDQQSVKLKGRSSLVNDVDAPGHNSNPRRHSSGAEDDEEEDDGEVAEFLAYAVPAVALAVLVLIYFSRTKR